jgi:hypothetical protein
MSSDQLTVNSNSRKRKVSGRCKGCTLKNMTSKNRIQPLKDELHAKCGTEGMEIKVDLVLDNFLNIKRPESPYKYIDDANDCYSHILKVDASDDNDKPKFISINQWKREVKKCKDAELPTDTIPLNYDTDLNPWDIISAGIISENTAEAENWKRYMKLYKRGIPKANCQGY